MRRSEKSRLSLVAVTLPTENGRPVISYDDMDASSPRDVMLSKEDMQ
jgi:hypothetical protein